jgi:hypothetical protein
MFLLGAILLAAGFAQADIICNFTSGNESWTSNITGQARGWADSVGSGTPKGSYRVFNDNTSAAWYFVAPAKFLGDKSGFYGGKLIYEVRISNPSSTGNNPFVILSGNGVSLGWYSSVLPGNSTWTEYAANFIETAGWLNMASGSAATQAQMRSVLAGLDSVQIRGEFSSGNDGYIDNVVMAIPEPVTVMLTGLGLLLIRRK